MHPNHNYLMALAMASNNATLHLSTADIPVKITEIDSEGGAYSSPTTTFKCMVVNDDKIKATQNAMNRLKSKCTHVYVRPYEIDRVIFNNPATIVIWADGTKTVVKCQEGDVYSKETGLAVAIAKKVYGNKGNFNDIFKKFIPEYGKGEDTE